MSVDISNRSSHTGVTGELLAELTDLCAFLYGKLYLSSDVVLSLNLVDTAEMEELHISWMDLKGPTDVLSFPLDELEPGTAEEPVVAGELGDIVLCVEVAQEQADQQGHSLNDELGLLLTHSMLHLLGYDHDTPALRQEMFSLQDQLLSEFLGRAAPQPTETPQSDELAAGDPIAMFPEFDENYRAGFSSFVGRPNSGKSTLTNALMGEKVAITSSKPQTTRHTIRAVLHRPEAQVVLVDTPGLHRPRTLLGSRLNDLVIEILSEVDVIGFCIPANEKIGPGDRFIASQLQKVPRTPVVVLVTKTDTVSRDVLAQQLMAVSQLGEEFFPAAGGESGGFAQIIPVSAATGEQVDVVADQLTKLMPHSTPLYPVGELTDQPEAVMVAELVREAALEDVSDELPHSIAVVVEEILLREGRAEDKPLLDVRVNIYVERDSQKAIIIGKGGSRLKAIGTQARTSIVKLLGTPIYLDLHVKVSKEWQRDPKKLQRLGF